VLDAAAKILQIARGPQDGLVGALRLGVIPTIGPYLLPELIPVLKQLAPRMPLEIEENLTANLATLLKDGEIDCAIIALPFQLAGVKIQALYDEEMSVVVPSDHPWHVRRHIAPGDLAEAPLLLLNAGHCFRDQVVEACPGQGNTAHEGRAGSSLETIRNMVASGLGISVLPAGAVARVPGSPLLTAVPFAAPAPTRRVGIAWRESFARQEAVAIVAKAVGQLKAPWILQVAADGAES
jgi:LysR family transcriptional regulator, hydrogen peroxide-inducible genes activator